MNVPVTLLPERRTLQLELFELAPGVRQSVPVPRHPKAAVPRVGIVRWVPEMDGRFRPEVETHPAVVNLKDWNEKAYGCTKFVIAALVMAGFVDGERIAPRSVTILLESWFAHRERMRENPWFWTDGENRERYQKARNRVEQQWRLKERTETASQPPLPESAVSTPAAAENASPCHGESRQTGKKRKASRQPGTGAPSAAD